MKSADVPFSCNCGRLHGVVLDVAPSRGNHVKCYCRSCQTAASFFDCKAMLDANGGTSVFQTVPSKINFERGLEHLACLRLSPKGLLRWYASCCDTPLMTMPDASWFPIAGLNMATITDDKSAFGDVIAVHQSKQAQNPPKGLRDFGLKRAAAKLFWRALRARLRRDSPAPFFYRSGKITVTPRVLSLAERRAAEPR